MKKRVLREYLKNRASKPVEEVKEDKPKRKKAK